MASLLEVALHRGLRFLQPAVVSLELDGANFPMRPEKDQIGKARRDARPFQAGRGYLVAPFARSDVRIYPARHDPAPDGVDHGAMQLIFARRRESAPLLPARLEQMQLPLGYVDSHDAIISNRTP